MCCYYYLAILHSLWDLSSPFRVGPLPSAAKSQSPSHWTTREVPGPSVSRPQPEVIILGGPRACIRTFSGKGWRALVFCHVCSALPLIQESSHRPQGDKQPRPRANKTVFMDTEIEFCIIFMSWNSLPRLIFFFSQPFKNVKTHSELAGLAKTLEGARLGSRAAVCRPLA